jgi:hypothetical protein
MPLGAALASPARATLIVNPLIVKLILGGVRGVRGVRGGEQAGQVRGLGLGLGLASQCCTHACTPSHQLGSCAAQARPPACLLETELARAAAPGYGHHGGRTGGLAGGLAGWLSRPDHKKQATHVRVCRGL